MEGADLNAALVHEAESLLDALRLGKGDTESDWVDLLLNIVDHLRKVLGMDKDEAAPVLSERLQNLLHEWAHQEKAQTRGIGFPLDRNEALKLKTAVSSGLIPFVLEKLVGEELDLSAAEALPVFDAVAEAGSLIARRLVTVKGSGSVLTIVFATDKTQEDLSFIIFDPFYPISGVQEAEIANERSTEEESDRKPSPPDYGKLKRILIVEDEPIALMLLQHFLSPYGRIDTAENGVEAVEKFVSALNGKDPFCVLFLDIMLPGIQGHSVLEEVRKYEQAAGVFSNEGARVVMASSLGDYSSISVSFQNQADAYLVKPIDSQTVDKTMAKFGFSKMVFPFIAVPKSRKPV